MFAADARKHTPGKNAEKENFSMRILVCDDDAAFAGQLAEKIEAIVKPQMPRSTVDCATDAAQLRALPLAKYDLAFLDIDMGPLNGVDLARRLHELRPDMLLIFVTNYVEYSLQGYEVQAFRYLLKAEMPQKLERYVQQALTAYRKTHDTVRIFCDGEDVELQPQQILYAEMSARKVCLHLQGATGPCCTRPLPWPIWLTYWKTTASCAHTKAFWSIWSTSAICKARDCICATEPSCRSVRTQPVPCGKSIRSGGARKNGLLVRDRFQLLGRAVRGRFLRCVS